MNNLKVKGARALSKIAQKSIHGGFGGNSDPWDRPSYCYKQCVNSGNSPVDCRRLCG